MITLTKGVLSIVTAIFLLFLNDVMGQAAQTGFSPMSSFPWNSPFSNMASLGGMRRLLRRRRAQNLIERGWIPPPNVQSDLLSATSSSSTPSSPSQLPDGRLGPRSSFVDRFDFGFSPEQLLSSSGTVGEQRVPGEWNSMSQVLPFQRFGGGRFGDMRRVGGAMPPSFGSEAFSPPRGPPAHVPGGGVALDPTVDLISGTGVSVSDIASVGVNELTHDHSSDTPHVHEAEGIIHTHPHAGVHSHNPADPNFMDISGMTSGIDHIDLDPTHSLDLAPGILDPNLLPPVGVVGPQLPSGYNDKGSVDLLTPPVIVDPLHDHAHGHVDKLAPMVLPGEVPGHDHVDVLSPGYVPPIDKVKVSPVLPDLHDAHGHNQPDASPANIKHVGSDDHGHDHGPKSDVGTMTIKHVGSVVVPSKKLPASYVSPAKGLDAADHKAAILAIQRALAENEALSIRMEKDLKQFQLEGNPTALRLQDALAENKMIRIQLEQELKEHKHELAEHAHVHKPLPPPTPKPQPPRPSRRRRKKKGFLKGLLLGGLGALMFGK